MQLRVCFSYRLNGSKREDVHRIDELLGRAINEHHSPACACYTEHMRAQASPLLHVARQRLVMIEPPTASQKDVVELLWSGVSLLCDEGYVCPITIMMTGLASTHDIMYPNSHVFSDSMRSFYARHRNLMNYYYDAVSMPCYYSKCVTCCCQPGAYSRCNRCGLTFCCDVCLDSHTRRSECDPGRLSLPFVQPLADRPKPYLEHILSMFGIDLSVKCESQDSDKSNKLTSEQCDEIVTKADSYCQQSRHLPALRLYNAAIDSLTDASPDMIELLVKRCKANYYAGLVQAAMSDIRHVHRIRDSGATVNRDLLSQLSEISNRITTDSGMMSKPEEFTSVLRKTVKKLQVAVAERKHSPTADSRKVVDDLMEEFDAAVVGMTDMTDLCQPHERLQYERVKTELTPQVSAVFSDLGVLLDNRTHGDAASLSTNHETTTLASSKRNRRKKDKKQNRQQSMHDEDDDEVEQSSARVETSVNMNKESLSCTASAPVSSIERDYTLIPWNVLEHSKYDGCAVCYLEANDLEAFCPGQNAVVFKCKHALCSKCLCQLVTKSRDKSDVITSLSCPMCRAELPSNILTVVAKQFIVDDHSAVELQSLAESIHLRKPDEVCVSLMTKNNLDVTSTYNALFMMTRMMTDVNDTVVKNVLEHSRAIEKLELQFGDPLLDTASDAFTKLKVSLQTSKATLQDTISQAIKGLECWPIYNNGALTCSVKGFDIDACTSALTSVILPILPVYGRTSINDIDSAIKQKFTDAIPPHVRHETRDGVMILKSLSSTICSQQLDNI